MATTIRALVVLLLVVRIAHADTSGLLTGLDTDNPAQLDAAVSAIEHAPTTPDLADVLFAAGRACEDRLLDPARALALYDRIVRELPDAGVAIAAQRRIDNLHSVRGHEQLAARFAALVAHADTQSRADVVREADALAAAGWPGAPDTALWLADWLCRTHQFSDAQARYAAMHSKWPDTEQTRTAQRNAAGCALDAHDFGLARTLAEQLPMRDDVDAAVKADLLAAAKRGRARERLYTAGWIALVLACLALLASLADASLRGGRRRPALKPPIEVMFLAPLALVVVIGSYMSQRAIAPTVLRISVTGIALSYLSGVALDALRARGRSVRLRALVHVVAIGAAVVAIGYISITRDGLIDMFAETVKYGPGD